MEAPHSLRSILSAHLAAGSLQLARTRVLARGSLRCVIPRRVSCQALKSPQFLVLGGTFFLCCAAHSGPIFHMVSYAIFCGIPTMAAVSI